MSSLRRLALKALEERNIENKCELTLAIKEDIATLEISEILIPEYDIPGKPDKPELIDPKEVMHRSAGSVAGRASLLHSIAHIEFNAINLALDIVWRFAGMPKQFYLDWLQVAKEEVFHFNLVSTHLKTLNMQYGDLPAHSGLWDICSKTSNDIKARLALVPVTLEARGLDVNPGMQDKLKQAGDIKAVEILEIILRDEIGHVRFGTKWFNYACEVEELDPLETYKKLLDTYGMKKPKGPFNINGRKDAGFTEATLNWLNN
ncbi:ferritin-like domain-containing protein [Taylorella equigenitalis]|uniref:Ferritin-like domain-containing protein n=1 Tax=Taylorella equigenitalis 14/56 TaxID=1091497 RepID=I7JJG3_9BURK|nr:ferritin-like domain-containing protein [Taylorella equigenitalis]WDU47054.1 ferritin-like domain-containing protein [Taylorella equigenitalis]WDU48531.1 ferritin-like domain-containing protein [Taylorella equigenitalis]WDU54026.1 ferritin-like domain-containing protein [Taylorella equigenitalis]CCG17891.1 conserved hypothetical protein [Taylorella equigenitalis 14/56]